ncbi:MAG: RNA polymerase sigma factor [Acidobacteriota bacterium]
MEQALANRDTFDVAAAKGGDQAAFERLYRAHAGRILALCARLTGDRSAAEDLTQEAFVKAWEGLPSFRGECAFASWLHRVAVRVVLDEARAKVRRPRTMSLVTDPGRGPGSAPPRAASSDVDLERAVAALPEGARRVFVLHDVHGFSHEEIAELAGLAPGTSKAQLHRARKLLREALR